MNSTERFSNRVSNYIKYRPGYPQAVVDFLRDEFALTSDKKIADIGAGTGISSELFLSNGFEVTGVEPNDQMRQAASALLKGYNNFSITSGAAEATLLPAASVDAIIAGQAFHWFDKIAAKSEFARILLPGGILVLMWNERRSAGAFEKEYASFIERFGNDFVPFEKRIDADQIAEFFAPAKMLLKSFDNFQSFDLEGLTGRLLSSSYMPLKGEDNYEPMIQELQHIFDRHQLAGKVTITYETKIFAGEFLPG